VHQQQDGLSGALESPAARERGLHRRSTRAGAAGSPPSARRLGRLRGARIALVLALAGLLVAPGARATEGGAGLINGVCGLGAPGRPWYATRWCGAVRGDVLFGRQRDGDAALGVSSSVGTASFEESTWTVGAAGLASLSRAWVGEVSVGPLWRRRGGDSGFGASAWLFLGRRRHNPWSAYSMAWGAALGYERSFFAVDSSTLILGARLDGVLVAIPAMLGWEALRGCWR